MLTLVDAADAPVRPFSPHAWSSRELSAATARAAAAAAGHAVVWLKDMKMLAHVIDIDRDFSSAVYQSAEGGDGAIEGTQGAVEARGINPVLVPALVSASAIAAAETTVSELGRTLARARVEGAKLSQNAVPATVWPVCVSAQPRTPTLFHPTRQLPPGPQLRKYIAKGLAREQHESPPMPAVLRGLPVLHRALRADAMASPELSKNVAENPYWAIKGQTVAVRWVPVATLLSTSKWICQAADIAGLPHVIAPPGSAFGAEDFEAAHRLFQGGKYASMIHDVEHHVISQVSTKRADVGKTKNRSVFHKLNGSSTKKSQRVMVKDVDGNVLRLSMLLLKQLAQREMRAYFIDRLRAVSPDLVVDGSPHTPSRPQKL